MDHLRPIETVIYRLGFNTGGPETLSTEEQVLSSHLQLTEGTN